MPEPVVQEYIEAPQNGPECELAPITATKTIKAKRGRKKGVSQPSELLIRAFRFYRDPKSETYLDLCGSMRAAGYTEQSAKYAAWKYKTRFADPKFKGELAQLLDATPMEAVAVLAAGMRGRTKGKNGTPDKVALLAARAVSAMHGVPTSDAVAIEQHNHVVRVDKLLVIGSNGATEERLKALTGSKDVSV